MSEALHFGHLESIALQDVPVLPIDAFAECVVSRTQAGARVLAFFGLPEAQGSDQVGLFCLLADDASHSLEAVRTGALTAFPSLTPSCPQVHLFEREIFEQWQIKPEGHPWLKPVRYCPPRNGEVTDRPGPAETSFYKVTGNEVHEVAVGPVHAGIIEPGHFRFQCYGENVLHLEIQLGFQHRDVERLVLQGPSHRTLKIMECVAGDSTTAHTMAYCTLLEHLAGVEVPERGRFLRRAALELERLANHTGDLGAIGGDTGYLPTSAWNGRIRGDFLNMTASLCGNRFGRGLVCPGGTALDADTPRCVDIVGRLHAAYRDVRGAVDTMLASHSVLARLSGTGCVSKTDAAALGLVGMAARACGLNRDDRFAFPVDGLDAEGIALRTQSTGDVLGRTLVRSQEVDDSAKAVELALMRLSFAQAGPCRTEISALPPNRCAVGLVEGWRGEICHVGITDERGQLVAYKIVDPSFHNWMGLAMALRDEQISDFPLCNKSFNLSYCGHDL